MTSLLAIDQGTTSTRAILFDRWGKILAQHQIELPLICLQNGWVEQDPEVIWRDTVAVCRAVLKQTPEDQPCVAFGITNQRETTILWDRVTGQPIYNAIVWQDRRTAAQCQRLSENPDTVQTVRNKTGLLLDPYFSCTKLQWILDNVPGARAKAQRGELAFGTIDSFLLWRLTGGTMHATDATNASRTGLFNIRTQQWDQTLLDLYQIPRSVLPEVKDNVADFGMTDINLFGQSYKIGGMAGDQQAALIGQCCFDKGMMKSTYGTGCFALMNSGSEFTLSSNQLLTTIAYRLNGQVTYAMEGSIFVAGAAVQWLRDQMQLFDDTRETSPLAQSVNDNHGVYFVPAFTGLGAPYWNPDARGMITGLTRDTSKAHIVRAALEAQAYQTMDLLLAMHADTTLFPDLLRIDGGLANNEFVCQFLADILQADIEIQRVTETTALGAAYLAGLSTGVFLTLEGVTHHYHAAKQYQPQMPPETAAALYKEWLKRIKMLVG